VEEGDLKSIQKDDWMLKEYMASKLSFPFKTKVFKKAFHITG
jgi:hypothetical protein